MRKFDPLNFSKLRTEMTIVLNAPNGQPGLNSWQPTYDEAWEKWYSQVFGIDVVIKRDHMNLRDYYVSEEQYTLICLRWL